MRRALSSLLLLVLAAVPARGHFIWLLPEEGGKRGVRMVFSDKPAPDNADLLKKIAHAEVFVVGTDGKRLPVKFAQKKDAFALELPGEGLRFVAAVCQYGVVQRGKDDPFLLTYYAKTW